jgi:hypothetical protein
MYFSLDPPVRSTVRADFTSSPIINISSSVRWLSPPDTGTGKSVLLREIINVLGGASSQTVGITASTGIAAVNIGGTTLHSWAGIGLGQGTASNLAGKIFGQPLLANVLERWRQVKSLIIDESVSSEFILSFVVRFIFFGETVSMIDGELFDKIVGTSQEMV